MKVHSQAQVKRYTRSRVGNFFFFFFLFLFGAFSVIPLVYSIVTSFKPLDELLIFPPSLFVVKRPTLENYLILPSLIESLEVPFLVYAFNSLFVTTVGTVLHVLASAAAAFVLSKSQLKYRKTIFMIVQLSLLFNAYTLMIPRYLIYSGMGIIDTFWAYILPAIPSSMGVFLMKQFYEGIPSELCEAARIDGMSEYRIYAKIMLPLSKPALSTLTIFTFVNTWNDYLGPLIYLKTEQKKTIQLGLKMFIRQYSSDYGLIMAGSVLSLIPVLAVFLCLQKYFVEGVASTGLKG